MGLGRDSSIFVRRQWNRSENLLTCSKNKRTGLAIPILSEGTLFTAGPLLNPNVNAEQEFVSKFKVYSFTL